MNFMDALGENLTRYLHQKYFGEHGEIRFTKLVASADIDYGSIKFENGKIEISSKSLMVILAVLGGIQGGVMNYKDAKENIQELSQDVRYFVCNYAPENHYKVLEMYCQPRDAEDVIKDLERTQQ
tara:strand:+ start:168 stop:542 length:375 start_codon:yes stop_codon:yes gene_type:complete